MCGIFGWSFKRRARIPAAQREILASTLAVANSYRGDQSWGVFYLDKNGGPHVRRQVGDIADVSGISALGMWDVLMAHTRYATTGEITKHNQHPFRVGSVLLAHNGMVFNHRDLNSKYERACTVDSQHFAHHLNEGRDFSEIEAYGSLEWIEGVSRNVNLCRMRQGQLAIYGIKNARGKQVGVVWSSDAQHLRSAIGAARLDAFPYVKPEEGHVYYAANGKLFEDKSRKLACAEPAWDPRGWAAYRSTQGGARSTYNVTVRDNGTRVYTFRGEEEKGKGLTASEDARTTAIVQAWLKRKEEEGLDAKELEREVIQLDEGLVVDADGQIRDTALAPDDAPSVRQEVCDTCGSLLGFNPEGECRECFTPREDVQNLTAESLDLARRIANMTDAEFEAFESTQRSLREVQ